MEDSGSGWATLARGAGAGAGVTDGAGAAPPGAAGGALGGVPLAAGGVPGPSDVIDQLAHSSSTKMPLGGSVIVALHRCAKISPPLIWPNTR